MILSARALIMLSSPFWGWYSISSRVWSIISCLLRYGSSTASHKINERRLHTFVVLLLTLESGKGTLFVTLMQSNPNEDSVFRESYLSPRAEVFHFFPETVIATSPGGQIDPGDEFED